MVSFSKVALLSLVLGSALAQSSTQTTSTSTQTTSQTTTSTQSTTQPTNQPTNQNNTIKDDDNKSNRTKVEDGGRKIQRALEFKESPKGIAVQSKLNNTTSFKYSLSTDGIPRFRTFMYEKDTDEETKYKHSFMVGMLRVVEVNDTITWKNSSSFINLKESRWSPFTRTSQTVNVNGTNATLVTVKSTYTHPTNATVTLSTYLAADRVPVPGQRAHLKPNQIKYGLEINDFAYKYINSTLALVKVMYSKEEQKYIKDGVDIDDDGVKEQESEQISLGAAGGFSWNSTVELKKGTLNTKGAIVASTLIVPDSDFNSEVKKESDDEGSSLEVARLMLFKLNSTDGSHIQPSKVVWDPELSVDSTYKSDAVLLAGPQNSAFRAGAAAMSFTCAMAGLVVAFLV